MLLKTLQGLCVQVGLLGVHYGARPGREVNGEGPVARP